jgi:hypothetical protein
VGEKESEPFQFTFNGFLKVAFQGSRVTSDAGLILVRELDERLGLEAIIAAHLRDSRQGLNTQFPLPDLLRQSIYSRLAGYEDLNDAARLSTDPTFRLIGSPKRWDRSAALTSTLHWFETELLTREENLVGLMAVNRDVIGHAETWDRSNRPVLDLDSSESAVHGQQEGSAYNGHFESVCYHPLFLFNDHGDCLAAKLRPGNVSSADDWEELLVPEIDRQQAEGQRVAFRADAAFARPAFTRRWRHAAWAMPSASLPTNIWSWRSKTFYFGRRVDPAGSRWSAPRASTIRRTDGPQPDGSWRTSASCSRASASS